MEQAKSDVSVEKIKEKIQQKKNSQIEKNTLISKEEQSLIDKYPIDKLMEGEGEINQFFKLEEKEEKEKKDEKMQLDESLTSSENASCESFKEINYINKGNKNMTDKTKTGYIYYQNDLKQIIDNLIYFYNLDDKNISEQLILEHHNNFKNLFIILEILIDRNKAHLEDDCVFNKKNLDIFSFIPNTIISIINNSLKGLKSGETEIKFGLILLKYISNSQKFVDEFIKDNGMEQLYNIILMNNEHFSIHSSSKSKKEIMPSVLLKTIALENIYKLLTFNSAYEKLVEKIDKNNSIVKDFLLKEPIKEKISSDLNGDNNEDEKDRKSRDRERERSRDRSRDRDRDRESRHKRRSKSRTHSNSSSPSNRYRSRSRSRSHNRKGSEDSRLQRKEKRKSITLNNGLQILSTLLISKKNILLTNIMKNISKKINLIQYLKNPEEKKITLNDFEKLKIIGRGSFGNVYLVRYIKTNRFYAMKVLFKSIIKQREEEEHTISERLLMAKLNHPLIVKMHFCFQDPKNLYFIMDLIQGGDLLYHLRLHNRFDDEKTRFYIAELILILEFLHENNVIYRDIKPENILIDKTGHIKLVDFGLSKIFEKNEKMYTICGTSFYLAPELIIKKGYNCDADWWSLGCLVYELLSGIPPFKMEGNDINTLNFDQPLKMDNCFSEEAKDLINKLLVKDPKQRLGAGDGGVEKLKQHPYFKSINWDDLKELKVTPPFIPEIRDDTDLKYIARSIEENNISNSVDSDNNIDNYVNFSFYEESLSDIQN